MKRFFLPRRTWSLGILLFLAGTMVARHASADTGVTLYTPYTRISVPPGQSIDYQVDVINNTSSVKTVAIAVNGIPRGWIYDIKSSGWNVTEISVLPKEKKNLVLRVEVPMKVNKGNYRFSLVAPGIATLPLSITVSEQGTFKTELTTRQPNMQGNASAIFSFNVELKNRTAEAQAYALQAQVGPGWNASFKKAGQSVTSVQIAPNQTETLSVDIDPPDGVSAGTYRVPISAFTNTTSANLQLEAVVTGTYLMDLSTPTGLLSTSITAGDEKRIELVVRNTGSSELRNITFGSSAPVNWDILFDPKQVSNLPAGGTAQVFATIRSDRKAIAGDYMANVEAKTPEVTAKNSLRVSVRTSMLYGWIGVAIIGTVAGGVYGLFRKYGRR